VGLIDNKRVIAALSSVALRVVYRDWLFEWANREAREGFSRLLAMKSDKATYFSEATAKWSIEDRHRLVRACIKRMFASNHEMPPLPLDEAELAARAAFDYPYTQHLRSPDKPGVEFVWKVTGVHQIIDADKMAAATRHQRAGLGEYKLNREALKKSVSEALSAEFGEPRNEGGGNWSYSVCIDDSVVATNVDFGARRPTQVRYGHQIRSSQLGGRPGGVLLWAGGICNLLGQSQSEWRYLTDEDVPAAAELLRRVSKEFVEGVPWMLERARSLAR
jgi:hypothetical protein